MKLWIFSMALAIVLLSGLRSDADVIIDSLGDNINQANLTADVGQTFTTGTLTDTLLSTIIMGGPASGSSNFGIEISVNGSAHGIWNPGASLGEVGPLAIPTATDVTFDFTSLGINLSDNTVYALRFTDGAGTSVDARFGLSNGATAGTGGNAPGAFADGTLFSGGALVFGDGFDAAIQVNTTNATIPEPASLVVLGIGAAGMVVRRRRV